MDLTFVCNGGSLHVSAKWEEEKNFKDQRKSTWLRRSKFNWKVSFRQTSNWKCMWFDQSRLKLLNIPENQNRKSGWLVGWGGGVPDGVSDFCKHKEDKGRGLTCLPQRPPSPSLLRPTWRTLKIPGHNYDKASFKRKRWLVCEQILHSCVLSSLILSSIVTQYIRMTFVRPRLVRFMLRYDIFM